MFSGIHSLFFRKKRNDHSSSDDSNIDGQSPVENDFVVIERRHSSQPTDSSLLYPTLGLNSSGQLPYAISPSLPSLSPTMVNQTQKSNNKSLDSDKYEMLSGVPFILSPQIDNFDEKRYKNITNLISLKDSFNLSTYNYDFSLESKLLQEMNLYKP